MTLFPCWRVLVLLTGPAYLTRVKPLGPAVPDPEQIWIIPVCFVEFLCTIRFNH